MEALNLRNAVKLYNLLKGHIPTSFDDSRNELWFIKEIVDSMGAAEYVHSVMLMTGKSLEDLSTMEPNDILELFVTGLKENRVISLIGYMQGLGI